MEHAHDLIRPWRRATIAVSAVAAVELVALVAVAIVLLGNPLATHLRETAAVASTTPRRAAIPVPAKKTTLDRGQTSVMVLNGGGRACAAHVAAAKVSAGDAGRAVAVECVSLIQVAVRVSRPAQILELEHAELVPRFGVLRLEVT